MAGRRTRLKPRLAAVIGALDDLPEPAAGLRHVDSLRIDRRSLHVINLPAAKVRTGDIPLLAFAVGGEDEGAFLGADEDADGGHFLLLLSFSNMLDRNQLGQPTDRSLATFFSCH